MMPPYETFKFDWLVASDQGSVVLRPEEGDVEWLPYPIPAELGEGGFQKIELAMGMAVFRGVHRFQPAAVGRLIPLAEVEVAFPEPTFQIQVVRGGRILHREQRPEVELLYGPGLDLFRLTDRIHLVPWLDGSQDSEMTCLTVRTTMLDRLIGSDTAADLFAELGLSRCPSAKVRPIPLHVSAHLHGAIPGSLAGTARKLYCQARMLDFLGALINHLQGIAGQARTASAKERAHEVHEFLLNTEGKPPTLDALATQFGRSARLLNEEFIAEYGQSIYAFITARRLEEAHAAILGSDVPLKALALRLGYTHVNHFNAAFKKKYGYPPGSLRRGRHTAAHLETT